MFTTGWSSCVRFPCVEADRSIVEALARRIYISICNFCSTTPLIYRDFEKQKRKSLKVGIEPPSTPLLGFQCSRGSRITGLSESIGECWPAPWLLRTKEVDPHAPPARIGYTTWKSFSRPWQWCDLRLIYATIAREMSKMKPPRAPWTRMCVPNLGPTSPTPVHSRT